ncbi:DUF3341 domain-containing protein [bacterium]|nr:DUF3341 domain-containing protein [bacterium]
MEMNKTFGLMAEYQNPGQLLRAAEKLRDAGYSRFETYSPFPIHGMDQAMGIGNSVLGWIVVTCGATGLATAIALQTWVSTSAYRIVTSGKPLFSFQAFVPVCFELMVLFSGFGAVFGMLALNRLPQLYHPMLKKRRFLTATSHGFFISVEAKDPRFSIEGTGRFLQDIGGTNIEVVEE